MTATHAPEAAPADAASSLRPTFWLGAMDLRAVALFRIALALVVVYDVLDLLPDATTFFSDEGVMPRQPFLAELVRRSPRIALSDVLSMPLSVYLYLGATLAAAALVGVGFRTRLSQGALFVLVAGLNERLPALFDGSDHVIRLTLFWLCWCPSGNRYSVDALRAAAAGQPLPATAPALPMRLLQGQIAALYLSAFRYKTLGASWMDGSALHYVLHTQHVFARNWTLLIADNAPLMALGTYSALVFEGIFPVMVFAPVARGQLKAAALLGGIALHLGIAATINVGHFSYLMPLTYLCLLEPAWVQRGVDGLQRLCVATPVRVVYDGERPLHQQAAAWLGAMDLYHRLEWVDTRSAPLPVTEPALRPEEVRARLHVIEPGGRVTRGFDALAVAFQRLPATFALAPFLRLPVLRPVGRALFDGWVARRLEGFTVQSRPAPLGERTLRWVNGLKHAAGATLFTAVVLHGYPGAYAIPRFGEDTLQLFSLWHGWDTFAPDPIQTDAHLRAVGTFSDGHQEDLFGGPVDGPGEVRGFLFSRWWKYFETVTRGAETYRREWGRWQCRTHREPGEPRLEQVVFIQERQLIPPIGQPWPKQKLGVWKHRCYKPRGGPASDPAAVPAAGPAGEEADADAGPPSPTLEQP